MSNKRINSSIRKRQKKEAVIFHLVGILIGFVMIYPLLWLLSSCFKSNDTIFVDSFSLIPKS